MDLSLLFCCQALRRNLSSPGYAWIIPGWYGDEWWRDRVSGIEINCTLEDLEDFLNSSVVVVSQYPDSLNDTAVTTSGIVSFWDSKCGHIYSWHNKLSAHIQFLISCTEGLRMKLLTAH